MTETDEQQDQLIRLLSPVHQIPHAASRPDGPAADELLRHIMTTSTTDVEAIPRRRARWSLRRRLAFSVPSVAALAAAAVVVTAVLPGSGSCACAGPEPAQAHALQFSQEHGNLVVKILDPVADPQRYRDEFAKHGLDIDLSLEPAAPDQVGRVTFVEDDGTPSIKEIEAPGNCSANGNCSVAIQVPLDYRGHASIVFGRTPKPGEDVSGSVVSPSQQARLDSLVGLRVSDARARLAAHGQTADYRVGWQSNRATADQVPGSWYVYQVAPVGDNVVVVWASADGKAPVPPKNPSAQASAQASHRAG